MKKVEIRYIDRVYPNQTVSCTVLVEDKGDKISDNRTAAEQFREKLRKLCNYPEIQTVYV